jgi:hypothetical protein
LAPDRFFCCAAATTLVHFEIIRGGWGSAHALRTKWGTVALAVLTAASASAANAADLFRPLVIGGAEVRWIAPRLDQPLTLRYAVADRDVLTADAINCGRLRAPDRLLSKSSLGADDVRRAAREAASRWSRVANIVFVETRDAAAADIVIGEQAEPRGLAFTNLTLAEPTGGALRGIAKAQICLNPEKRWNFGFDGNLTTYDLVHSISHEIGHAIGLDHPSARGHLMSFRYLETYDGLSDGDALGAISLYGARQGKTDRAAADGDIRASPKSLSIR